MKEGRLGEEGRVVGVGRDGRGGEGGVGEVGEEVLFVLQLSGGVRWPVQTYDGVDGRALSIIDESLDAISHPSL